MRERQFEIVGSGKKERAIRVRGVVGPEGIVAAKLWQREVRRRERARLRYVQKTKPDILRLIARICRQAPDTFLEGDLARFAVGDQWSIATYRRLIEDAIDGMTEIEVWKLEGTLRAVVARLPKETATVIASRDADPEILDDLRI